jgi:hypothetical protein
MLQPRTHFERVPLEVVRKIVEEELRRKEAADKVRVGQTTTTETDLVERQEQSDPRVDSSCEAEVCKQS